MQTPDFSLVLALAAGVASFLIAIYSTAFAFQHLTPG
jgi:hypothetical protein